MCRELLMRLFFVLFFVLSSLRPGGAAAPGDLISMTHLGTYSVSALEDLNDESMAVSPPGPVFTRTRLRTDLRTWSFTPMERR